MSKEKHMESAAFWELRKWTYPFILVLYQKQFILSTHVPFRRTGLWKYQIFLCQKRKHRPKKTATKSPLREDLRKKGVRYILKAPL